MSNLGYRFNKPQPFPAPPPPPPHTPTHSPTHPAPPPLHTCLQHTCLAVFAHNLCCSVTRQALCIPPGEPPPLQQPTTPRDPPPLSTANQHTPALPLSATIFASLAGQALCTSSKEKLRVSRLAPIRLTTMLLLRIASRVISSLWMCQSRNSTTLWVCVGTQQQQQQ